MLGDRGFLTGKNERHLQSPESAKCHGLPINNEGQQVTLQVVSSAGLSRGIATHSSAAARYALFRECGFENS